MTKEQFRHAVHAGLGRATLYARQNDVSGYRDIILDACLHFRGMDAQIEGPRAAFMYELIAGLPDRGDFRRTVVESLAACGDDRDAVQRFRLAAHFATAGDADARRAIHHALQPGPDFGEEIAVTLVDLDGLDGLRVAAQRIGALIAQGEPVDEGWLRSFAGERLGEREVREFLQTEAARDSNIAAYFAKSEESRKMQARRAGFAHLTYEQVVEKFLKKGARARRRWIEAASEDDILRAARDLQETNDDKFRTGLLCLFGEQAFPLDPSILFEHAVSEERRVRFAALRALRLIAHPEVRKLAFHLIESGDEARSLAVAMLDRNFQSGDHGIALQWMDDERDVYVLHGQTSDYIRLWEHHAEPASEIEMLRLLYEANVCSECRMMAVRRLVEIRELPEDVRAECAFDANEEIRELVSI